MPFFTSFFKHTCITSVYNSWFNSPHILIETWIDLYATNNDFLDRLLFLSCSKGTLKKYMASKYSKNFMKSESATYDDSKRMLYFLIMTTEISRNLQNFIIWKVYRIISHHLTVYMSLKLIQKLHMHVNKSCCFGRRFKCHVHCCLKIATLG